ncbi:MAG TPA: hypothetical protein VFV38_19365 [Ktedonobacteraceae bacterium]|nr:hypothetical protein [Ktedonobacteraceae bacterium]
MNQRSHQQHHHFNRSNRFQSSARGPFSRREALERELQYLERDLAALDAQIDALGEKGRLLEAAKNAHLASIPFAIAQVALSTLGVRYLPPVARTWHYQHQQYLRTEEQLKQHAVTFHARRGALVAQMEQIQIQIDMLQYHP